MRYTGLALIVVTAMMGAAGCGLLRGNQNSYVDANLALIDSLSVMPAAQQLSVQSFEYRLGESGPVQGYSTIVTFVARPGATFEDVMRFYEETMGAGWETERRELSAAGAGTGADGRSGAASAQPMAAMRFTRGEALVTLMPGRFGDAELPAGAGAPFFLAVDHAGATW